MRNRKFRGFSLQRSCDVRWRKPRQAADYWRWFCGRHIIRRKSLSKARCSFRAAWNNFPADKKRYKFERFCPISINERALWSLAGITFPSSSIMTFLFKLRLGSIKAFFLSIARLARLHFFRLTLGGKLFRLPSSRYKMIQCMADNKEILGTLWLEPLKSDRFLSWKLKSPRPRETITRSLIDQKAASLTIIPIRSAPSDLKRTQKRPEKKRWKQTNLKIFIFVGIFGQRKAFLWKRSENLHQIDEFSLFIRQTISLDSTVTAIIRLGEGENTENDCGAPC